MIGALRL